MGAGRKPRPHNPNPYHPVAQRPGEGYIMATTTNIVPSPSATADNGFAIVGRENVAIARLITLLHGVRFEARTGMLVTRVGGGATRIAKREFGLPRNTKPDAILAMLEARIAEAKAARQ